MTGTIDWSVEGPHVVNCNCDYGCPCQFMAPPTDGTCNGVVGFRVDKGHFGETRLDGLLAVNTYAWPGAIHEGNGAMQSIIDARADAAQRIALTAILQGDGSEPGASMLKIYCDMCSAIHEPVFSSIERSRRWKPAPRATCPSLFPPKSTKSWFGNFELKQIRIAWPFSSLAGRV